jgi:TolA-binding protein
MAMPAPNRSRVSALLKIVLVAGVAALALGVYLVAGQRGRSESQLLLEEKIKELQEKEQKIQTLEADAAKTRQTLTEQTGQLSELRTKLEESQKELASSRVRLGLATREADRLASSRSQSAAPTTSRPPDPVPPIASARRAAEAGVYETIRATSVHEEPSGSSRVLSQIGPGTRINVVRSVGDWLEVRSKQGNPPGFLRLDDAKFIARAN